MKTDITVTTLGYPQKDGKILMMHRILKKEDINAGKWIGIGGKLEAGESVLGCMQRECLEETGLVWTNPMLRAVITFCFQKAEGCRTFTELMFVYTGGSVSGKLQECTEGELAWISPEEIPSLSLWKGDRIFLKLLQERKDLFYMVLNYTGDRLESASLDEKPLDLQDPGLYL